MIIDNLKTTGHVYITLTGEQGEVKQKFDVPNLVVTAGKNYIASRLVDASDPAQMSHMAVGDSDLTPAISQTALTGEVSRVALTGINDSDNTVTFNASWAPGVGTGTLKEVGVFNDSATGTMLCRTTFGEVNKLAGDTLTIAWVVTIT